MKDSNSEGTWDRCKFYSSNGYCLSGLKDSDQLSYFFSFYHNQLRNIIYLFVYTGRDMHQ